MDNLVTTLTFNNNKVEISHSKPTVIIGERINPTSREEIMSAMKTGDFEIIRHDAAEQVHTGSAVIDINAGIPGPIEIEILPRVIKEVMSVVDVPLCIDTANPKALRAALEVYPGKALINSTNGEMRNMENVFPIAREFGAAVIGLCMDESGIPATPEERLKVAEKIIGQAEKFGIPPEDIVIDPLAMAMGTDPKAGKTTLDAVALIKKELGVNITLGASNVSFGLPDREYLNAAFLSMAIMAGMNCPITNSVIPEIRVSVLAADLTLGKDEFAANWLEDYRKRN